MARDFFINGESLVLVKGSAGSAIANLSELGLAEGPIRVTFDYRHRDMQVDAWGREIPVDVQWMLGAATITMNLIHFDRAVLEACQGESMGGAGGGAVPGTFNRAGTRMGGGAVRFAASNHYIGLNIASPVAGLPWRFFFTYLTMQPVDWPLGTEKSSIMTTWRAIPYTIDPWNGGFGAFGYQLFDRTLDS